MKPFIVLITVFVLSFFIVKLIDGVFEFGLPARIAMSVMLVFTSIAHFKFLKGMEMMVPAFIPFKKKLVIATGLMEIVFAVLLLIPTLQLIIAWSLIAFFLLLLPANIYAAMNKVDYEKGTGGGNGLNYLWFRIPLQVFFIVWVYFAAVN